MSEDVFRFIVAAGVILAAVACVAQTVVLFALYRLTRGGRDRFAVLAEKMAPLAESAQPILTSTQRFMGVLEENSPRISEASQDIAAITRTVRKQTVQLGALVEDATARATRRLAELDQTIDLAAEQVEQTGEAVKGAVLKPLREVNALLIGVRAAFLSYAQGNRRPSVDHATQDEEMFI